jgi:hypothetical protein
MIAGAACTSPTDSGGPPPVVLLGTWNYVSTQASSSAVDTGTMTVTAQSGHNFQGTFAVNQTDSSGTHGLSGPVSGQAVDSTTLNFDLFINGTTDRQHLGTVKADSITGSWVENGIASGSFRAARQVGP